MKNFTASGCGRLGPMCVIGTVPVGDRSRVPRSVLQWVEWFSNWEISARNFGECIRVLGGQARASGVTSGPLSFPYLACWVVGSSASLSFPHLVSARGTGSERSSGERRGRGRSHGVSARCGAAGGKELPLSRGKNSVSRARARARSGRFSRWRTRGERAAREATVQLAARP